MEKLMRVEQNSEALQLASIQANEWVQTLETKNPAVVANGYASDATFFPTKNGELKKGKEGAEKYFAHFLESDPVCTFKESSAFESADGKTVVYFGKYDFELNGEDNSRTIAHAQHTFVFERGENGKWEKKHHHSSLIQEGRKISKLKGEVEHFTQNVGEDVLKNFFEQQTGEVVETIVLQFSNDKTIVTASILHSSKDGLQNRSTVVLQKVNDAWQVAHHHFSPRPQ